MRTDNGGVYARACAAEDSETSRNNNFPSRKLAERGDKRRLVDLVRVLRACRLWASSLTKKEEKKKKSGVSKYGQGAASQSLATTGVHAKRVPGGFTSAHGALLFLFFLPIGPSLGADGQGERKVIILLVKYNGSSAAEQMAKRRSAAAQITTFAREYKYTLCGARKEWKQAIQVRCRR